MTSYPRNEVGATRREFLARTAGAAVLGCAWPAHAAEESGAWGEVAAILQRIKAPQFPKRDFEITRYGDTGDGLKDSTEAINRAVAECNRAGGGRVVVPA